MTNSPHIIDNSFSFIFFINLCSQTDVETYRRADVYYLLFSFFGLRERRLIYSYCFVGESEVHFLEVVDTVDDLLNGVIGFP